MTFKGVLYEFQDGARERMLDRESLLLTHDMGLGKTVTTIATIEQLIDEGSVEKCLVLCPASVKWQWKHMIDDFTDGALTLVIEGDKRNRWTQYRVIRDTEDVEYVLMNYEQVVSDWDWIRHFAWDAVVCDEVTYIKSPAAKRTRHVRRLHAPYKFGLTGQPIENRPEELWHIMQWIDPTVLGRFDAFDHAFIVRDRFGKAKHYKNLKTLRSLIDEAMDRKTRKDVADQMPDVVEEIIRIDLDRQSESLYGTIAAELIQVLQDGSAYSSFDLQDHYAGVGNQWMNRDVMPRLMALRMLCDHPALLTYSADQFDDPDAQAGSAYAARLRDSGVLSGLKRSRKMEEALDIIGEILDANEKNKVVLFSFFKPMLAMISDRLKIHHELFTGDLTARQRDEALTSFAKDPRCRVLLSSDAGGIGIDLPQANYLISYDLPWSAGKYKQRQTRIDRISSKWPEVTMISLVMRNSIEEWMLDVLHQKAAVAAAWLDGQGVDRQGRFELRADALCHYLGDHQSRPGAVIHP